MSAAAEDLDRAALTFMRTRWHAPAADSAAAAFSRLGEHGACWIALGLIGAAVDGGRRNDWLRGVTAVVEAYAVNQAIKFVVRRRRPELPGLPPLTGTVTRLSFPSAHATTSFAAAEVFGRLVPAGPLYAAAGALAVSRPYLGVHYPSDVLAGALLGNGLARLWR